MRLGEVRRRTSAVVRQATEKDEQHGGAGGGYWIGGQERGRECARPDQVNGNEDPTSANADDEDRHAGQDVEHLAALALAVAEQDVAHKHGRAIGDAQPQRHSE